MKRFEKLMKNKKSVSLICTVIAAVLVGGYVLAHLLGNFSEKLNITPASIASDVEYEFYDAYIFRNETVVESEYSGYRLDIVADGDMIGIGAEFARVYNTPEDKEKRDSIEAIDQTLALLEKCRLELNSSGINEARRVLTEGYRALTELLAKGDAAAAVKYKAPITEAMSMLSVNQGGMQTVKQNIERIDSEIERLRGERSDIVSSLGEIYESLTAEKTGYYYSGTDGYEGTMSSMGITQKTLGELLSAIDALGSEPTVSPTAVGRIVYDPRWYAAVPISAEKLSLYKNQNDEIYYGSYTVDFYDGGWQRTEMTLEAVIEEDGEDQIILLFSSNAMKIGFSGGRERRVRVLMNEYEGLRVPKDAIFIKNKDGECQKADALDLHHTEYGVFVLTYGTVEWRRIEAVYIADTYVLVKASGDEDDGPWLLHNESVIVGGRDLYDGKTVD